MNGKLLAAALCCATYGVANAGDEDPRLRQMLRSPVTAKNVPGAVGMTGAQAQFSFYCSKDTARTIGVTTLSVQGVSIKLYDYDGHLVAQDADQLSAQRRRADILNYRQTGLTFQEQVPDGKYYVALCDVAQHAQCQIPADRRQDPLDDDDGKDSIAVVGYVQSVQFQQGVAQQVGQAQMLFDLPRQRDDDDDDDDDKTHHSREGSYQQGGDLKPGFQQTQIGCDEVDSPLIIDLGNDGVALSGLSDGVTFDLDGDGSKNTVAWPTSIDDAFLAYDKDHSSRIENGGELFGNHYVGPDGYKSANGFLSLAKYDTNHDRKIDAADAVFKDLVLWSDKNRNGVSDPGEITSLAKARVTSISLDYIEKVEKDAYGNEIRQRSTAQTRDGVRVVVDAWLRRI